MPRPSLRSIFWLPGVLALLSLAACTPSAPTSALTSATPTWTPYPIYTATPTATLIPAATPTNVPAGWSVLDVHDFSIAFPQGTQHDYFPQPDSSLGYVIQPGVKLIIQENQVAAVIKEAYCSPNTPNLHPVTFAGLPMIYGLVGEEGGNKRDWMFVDAQGTSYELIANDTTASSDLQAQDDAILATFRPADTTPWSC